MEEDRNKLVTATGRVIDCEYVATNGVDAAFIRVKNISFIDAATVFSDREETISMTWQDYTLEGYTKLYRISIEGETILVHLGLEESV